MTTAFVHKIEARSMVDGPGERTVVFFQGCPLACPGCQNKHLWPENTGEVMDVADLSSTLLSLSNSGQFTISGGEPFAQPKALVELVWRLYWTGQDNMYDHEPRHIIVYSGYTWEELNDPSHPAYPYFRQIVNWIDVLVDGRFVKELDDPFITYRGSRNQRPIDVFETLMCGDIVEQIWDNEIQISDVGVLVLPAGLAKEFADVGTTQKSRMCGQTKG